MFDVGFLELVVIMVLGLLVLGPERLPKAAQKIGYWFGKGRRYVEGMKSQVEAEFDTSEVKRLLHNQEVQIRELQSKITDTETAIGNEYQNQFDDDDPGSSHEEAASAKAAGPQYDIIEDDDGSWGDEDDFDSVASDSKASSQIQGNHPQESHPQEDHPQEDHPQKDHPMDSAMSEVIKRNE